MSCGAIERDLWDGRRDRAFLNRVAKVAAAEGKGLGEIVGSRDPHCQAEFREQSVFATAYRLGAPATVHVAIGADIIHMHPDAEGAAIGAATMTDFHRLAAVVAELSRGVVINLGSAVTMPEVFLKALNLARNLGRRSPIHRGRHGFHSALSSTQQCRGETDGEWRTPDHAHRAP